MGNCMEKKNKNDKSKRLSCKDLKKIRENFKVYEEYEIGQRIGKGGFGEVRIVTHKLTNIKRALKIMKKD
jgi:serine/threonine protein kinase